MITKYRNPPEIAKESYIFPNWRNFAESGHTENQLSFTDFRNYLRKESLNLDRDVDFDKEILPKMKY